MEEDATVDIETIDIATRTALQPDKASAILNMLLCETDDDVPTSNKNSTTFNSNPPSQSNIRYFAFIHPVYEVVRLRLWRNKS